ncbi:gene transfer agent family protein [Sinorhizobium meliloti]|uniref:gene transfer agent family protein n=1 Tax=Rhizobium meliloti TaxID=382 RepID=UPI000FD784F4|nr:gene transfer agent family protein [Sinorhizobium meliloti]RVG25037.1 gene transfer agent family protein [Sinorhizobium meliloti]
MISHTAYFGDGEKTFTLTDTVIAELQHKTGLGIGALFLRMSASQFHMADIIEVIRLGLIGGRVNPQEAQRLVDAYAKDRPIDETLPLALDILDARWNGKPEVLAISTGLEPLQENIGSRLHGAAATGDLSAAINETLKETGL